MGQAREGELQVKRSGAAAQPPDGARRYTLPGSGWSTGCGGGPPGGRHHVCIVGRPAPATEWLRELSHCPEKVAEYAGRRLPAPPHHSAGCRAANPPAAPPARPEQRGCLRPLWRPADRVTFQLTTPAEVFSVRPSWDGPCCHGSTGGLPGEAAGSAGPWHAAAVGPRDSRKSSCMVRVRRRRRLNLLLRRLAARVRRHCGRRSEYGQAAGGWTRFVDDAASESYAGTRGPVPVDAATPAGGPPRLAGLPAAARGTDRAPGVALAGRRTRDRPMMGLGPGPGRGPGQPLRDHRVIESQDGRRRSKLQNV